MWQVAADEHTPPSAIQSTRFNAIQPRITPVDPSLVIVDGQTIRPAERRVYQNDACRAVQIRPLDLSNVAPITPVHAADGKTKTDKHKYDNVHNLWAKQQ